MLIRESPRSSFERPPDIEDRHLQLAVSGARREFWNLDWHQTASPIATESRTQNTLIATVNKTTAISTPTATDVLDTSQVPGRMLSLTMSWLKGGSKGQNSPKKRDITTSGSTTVGEEVSKALAVIPLQQNGITGFTDMEKESESPRSRGDLSHTPTSIAHTLMDAPPLAIEALSPAQPQQPTTGKRYDDPTEYILKDDLDTATVNDIPGNKISDPVSPAHGKKKGAKLRLAALNILKMKSSSFLRKPQDADEQQVASRRRDSVEPLSSSGDRMALIRSNTGAGPASASTPLRRPARLTKPPPADLMRQRRSTVVESIQEDSLDPLESRPPGWGTVALRPSSSQSSHPGVVARGDDITSLSQDPGVVTGGNVPGGLYPRPSSLKRHWSDGPQGKRESTSQMGGPAGSPQRAATEGSDRPRPFSFAGMLDQYGSMKITEAATLESRVRDLENQLATLQTFVTTHLPSTQLERRSSQKSSHLSHKSSRLTDKSAQTSPALGPPFAEEMALSKRPDTAQSDVTTSTFMHGHDSEYSVAPESSTNGAPSKASGSVDWRAIARGVPLTPNKTPYGDSSVSSYMSDETINIRHRPYGNLDGAPGPSTDASKRSTVYSMETITPRNQGRDYDMDYHRERMVQTPVVALSEYNGVLKQLRREYRARKKLEAQMQTLQEQMNHVLHRQLLQSDPIYNIGRSPTITGRSLATTSAASTQRPEPVMNGRRTSSEVPTPDLTPPRGRPDLAHLFPNFDSNASAIEDMDDDGGSYYIGGDDDGSENWQTPAEDTRSLMQIGGHLAPPLPLGTQKRTMSISQITEKASLASARAAANR